MPHLERVEIGAGDKLIEQGTPSDDIYFVEQAACYLPASSPRHSTRST